MPQNFRDIVRIGHPCVSSSALGYLDGGGRQDFPFVLSLRVCVQLLIKSTVVHALLQDKIWMLCYLSHLITAPRRQESAFESVLSMRRLMPLHYTYGPSSHDPWFLQVGV